MPRSKMYTVIGVDMENPYSDCKVLKMFAITYDLGSLTPNIPVHISNNVISKNYTTLFDTIHNLVCYLRNTLGKYPSGVRLLPGLCFSSGSALSAFVRADKRFEEQSSETTRGDRTFLFNVDNKNNPLKNPIRLKISKDMPWAFSLQHGKEEFVAVVENLIREVGIDKFLTHTPSVFRLVTALVKQTFNEEDEVVCSKANAGSLALLEEDLAMNAGGRMKAEHPGEVKKFVSFDINSAYTNIMLTKTFSTSRLDRITKMVPGFRNYKVFSPENRSSFMKVMSDLHNKNNIRMRVVLYTHDIYLKKDKDPFHIRLSRRLMGPDVKLHRTGSGEYAIEGRFAVALFWEEFEMLVDRYEIPSDSAIDEIYISRKVRLPRKTRELIWKTFVDCQRQKYKVKDMEKKYGDYVHQDSRYNSARSKLEYLKLERNMVAGYFEYHGDMIKKYSQQYAQTPSSEHNPDLICYYGSEEFKGGHLMAPLVGSEICLEGRLNHRKLEEFFQSRGYEVFYGHTDSIYVEDKPGVDDVMKAWNDMNAKLLNLKIKDLPRADFSINKGDLPGGIKIEDRGYCYHTGLNRMIIADENGVINKVKVSPYNTADILRELKGKSIYDLHPGYEIHNVGKYSADGNVSVDTIKL